MEPADKVVELNKRLKAYAIKHNLAYVDYFTPMANERNALKTELGEDVCTQMLQVMLLWSHW